MCLLRPTPSYSGTACPSSISLTPQIPDEPFFEALRYWITPDAWSWLKGEGVDDLWAEMKLLVFLIACIAIVAGEHFALKAWVL